MKKKIILISIFLISAFLSQAQTPSITYIVPDISAMQSYFGKADRVYVVADTSDYVLCPSCTVDGSTVYSGAGGRKWLRIPRGSNSAGTGSTGNADSLNHVVGSSYVTRPELADSGNNIRTSIPAQFNPIAGTGMSLSGTYPNITFNASGGAIAGLYQKLTATAGQTAFTFTLIPTDANKVGFYINGSFVSQSFYSISGNTITFTSGLQLNDVVEEQGVQ